MFGKLSAAMWRRAQLQWALFALTALAIGIFAIGMGNFVRDNVRSELEYQKIAFGPYEEMSPSEKEIPGIQQYAGGPITDGAGAKVYSEYILLHMQESAVEANFEADDTYATLGKARGEAQAALEKAEASGDKAAIEEAQARLDEVSALRSSMLNGSNLRGQLLNSYGWDTVGQNVTYAGYGFVGLAVVFAGLLLMERLIGHLPPATEGRQPQVSRLN